MSWFGALGDKISSFWSDDSHQPSAEELNLIIGFFVLIIIFFLSMFYFKKRNNNNASSSDSVQKKRLEQQRQQQQKKKSGPKLIFDRECNLFADRHGDIGDEFFVELQGKLIKKVKGLRAVNRIKVPKPTLHYDLAIMLLDLTNETDKEQDRIFHIFHQKASMYSNSNSNTNSSNSRNQIPMRTGNHTPTTNSTPSSSPNKHTTHGSHKKNPKPTKSGHHSNHLDSTNTGSLKTQKSPSKTSLNAPSSGTKLKKSPSNTSTSSSKSKKNRKQL